MGSVAGIGPKVQKVDGGDTLVVASGGKIQVETGGQIVGNGGSLQGAYTQTYSTAHKSVLAATAGALTVADGAGTNDGTIGAITDNATTIAAVQELAAAINALIADNLQLRKNVNALIDDLQALGMVG